MAVVEVERVVRVTPDLPEPRPLTNEDKERALLELAADILVEEGWCRGGYSVFGRHCALGAIGAAMRRTPGVGRVRRDKAVGRLVDHIYPENSYFSERSAIVEWNDENARGAEVIRALKEAAAG